ncbi:hypothetical protein QYF36_017374 [Acer negundo]|nr:hypothetical protein QYF36_017374 [Acer negundo]
MQRRKSLDSEVVQVNLGDGREPVVAKLLVILKAYELCSTNSCLSGFSIQVVSDSLDTASWVNNLDDFGNLNNLNAITDIKGYLSPVNGLFVIYKSRASNSDADRLSKRSSNGGIDSLEWFGL